MIRRIVCREANVTVRFDITRDDHLAWLACRYILGDSQKKLARLLNYKRSSMVCNAFRCFIHRHYPEAAVDYVYDVERKALLLEAVKRFHRACLVERQMKNATEA
jgi:hypothetical protein